jgi:hypothetical protein
MYSCLLRTPYFVYTDVHVLGIVVELLAIFLIVIHTRSKPGGYEYRYKFLLVGTDMSMNFYP